MRLIDADALKDELREKVLVYEERVDREKSRGRQRLSDNFSGATSGLCQAITILSIQPTVEERKKGKWIKYDNSHCECPFCHKEWKYFENMVERFNYCPNCGAKMGGVKDVQNKTS